MTVAELGERMSGRELTEWSAWLARSAGGEGPSSDFNPDLVDGDTFAEVVRGCYRKE